MKSTKVANVSEGCIVQTSTMQRNPDETFAVAEALVYVPGVHIDIESNPRRLVDINALRMKTFQSAGVVEAK